MASMAELTVAWPVSMMIFKPMPTEELEADELSIFLPRDELISSGSRK